MISRRKFHKVEAMSYYDNVKDNVKDKGDSGKPNFDTLRQAAEEHSEEEDEKKGDGTEIEVLEEGGLKNSRSSGSNLNRTRSRSKTGSRPVNSRQLTHSKIPVFPSHPEI
jgi:hypothetical protein